MLEALVAGLLAEPVNSLFGGGGVLGAVGFFVHWWRGRPRVVALHLAETFDTKAGPTVAVVIRVELENYGRESTSVKPSVLLRCRSAKRGTESYSFIVQEVDRTLPPVTPKALTLKATVPASYVFSHFRVFTFSLSRGCPTRVRVLNASGQPAGALKFAALEWRFRLFGALPHVRG